METISTLRHIYLLGAKNGHRRYQKQGQQQRKHTHTHTHTHTWLGMPRYVSDASLISP